MVTRFCWQCSIVTLNRSDCSSRVEKHGQNFRPKQNKGVIPVCQWKCSFQMAGNGKQSQKKDHSKKRKWFHCTQYSICRRATRDVDVAKPVNAIKYTVALASHISVRGVNFHNSMVHVLESSSLQRSLYTKDDYCIHQCASSFNVSMCK